MHVCVLIDGDEATLADACNMINNKFSQRRCPIAPLAYYCYSHTMCACSISISISVHQYTHNLFVVQDRLYCHSYIGGQVAAVSPIATTPTPLLPEWSRTQTWKAFSQLPDDLLGEALHVLVQVVVDAAALPASSHRRLRTLLEQRLCTCCPASSRFLAASRTRRRALLLVPVLQERRE